MKIRDLVSSRPTEEITFSGFKSYVKYYQGMNWDINYEYDLIKKNLLLGLFYDEEEHVYFIGFYSTNPIETPIEAYLIENDEDFKDVMELDPFNNLNPVTTKIYDMEEGLSGRTIIKLTYSFDLNDNKRYISLYKESEGN